MTLDRPLWMLLLLTAPALWWLHRRLHAPREVLVASVAALRGAQLEARGVRACRTPDLDLVLLLGAIVALAFSAAGPRWGGGAPALLVAVDTSASMLARAPSGEAIGDVAWKSVRARLAALRSDLEVVVVDLGAPRAGRRSALADAVAPVASASRADGLPGALAPVLARARADGFPGVLLVTDRPLDNASDVVASGPGVAAVPHAGLIDIVLDGDGARVTVDRARGGAGVLRVSGPGVPIQEWAVPVGDGYVVVTVGAPPRDMRATYELLTDGGAQTAALDVQRVGGVRAVRLVERASRAARVRALLSTLGIDVVAERLAAVDAEVLVGGVAAPLAGDDPPRLHLAAAVGGDTNVEVSRAAPMVAAGRITGTGVLAEAAPAPGVAMVCTGVLSASTDGVAGLWDTPDGALAVALPRVVLTTLDPEADASRWHTDPSFPVFLLAAFEHLAGGRDRLEVLDRTPPSELAHPESPVPVAEVARLAALVRSPDRDPATSSAGAGLAAAGAALLLAATLRGTGRFSSAGRR